MPARLAIVQNNIFKYALDGQSKRKLINSRPGVSIYDGFH